MNELLHKLRPEFQDEEYRHAYADECLSAMIAAQIKVLREQRGMTQEQLAGATGMKQPRIPLLEDASYENWTIRTLKRIARAFDVALSVKFESFSQLIKDFESLSRESLQRPTFAHDASFQPQRSTSRRFRRTKHFPSRRRSRNWAASRVGQVPELNMGAKRKSPRGATGTPTPQAAGGLGLHLVPAVGGNR
jgi:transcriptional regulator with XRE-family HTH domain